MRTNEEIVRILIDEKNKQNLSISELARRVDMAKSAISRYFNFSREFPLNRADDFARVLGISTEYLLGITKDEISNKAKKQSPIVEEIAKVSSQLEEPRQQIVLDTASSQLKEQEEQNKVKQIEDYRLSDEYLEEQISKASAYGGGQLNDNDKEFFKRLLKNTLKEKIDKGDL
ncbi:helix-turn-helix domain-containing protein [Lactococcus lactis]